MRAFWRTVVRVAREVAYGVNALHAMQHRAPPVVPPYPPPVLFSTPPAQRQAPPCKCTCAADTETDTEAGAGR